jgi:beta-glucosidase
MGNNSEFDRHNSDSIIDERTMRGYLPVFEAAVKEAMSGRSRICNLTNGQHMSQNKYHLPTWPERNGNSMAS